MQLEAIKITDSISEKLPLEMRKPRKIKHQAN
jgi:hypothetical protein